MKRTREELELPIKKVKVENVVQTENNLKIMLSNMLSHSNMLNVNEAQTFVQDMLTTFHQNDYSIFTNQLILMVFNKVTKTEEIQILIEKLDSNFTMDILQLLIDLKRAQVSFTPMQNDIIFDKCLMYFASFEQGIRKRSLILMSMIHFNQALPHLLKSMTDHDARVRECILTCFSQLNHFDEIVYNTLIKSITDDDKNVRRESLEFFWIFINKFGNVTRNNVRIIDDGFSYICMMIRDIDILIRSRACFMIGHMPEVSDTILMQTFKKVELNSKREENPNEIDASGEYDVSLNSYYVASFIVGSVILGLEDEFWQVRIATIKTLSNICTRSQDLFSLCIHHLIDMFSDEIDQVRKKAIDSVSGIGATFSISQDQMEIMISLLKDFSSHIRHSIQHLFTCVIVPNVECLGILIRELLQCLGRYAEDKNSLLVVFQHLGQKHAFMAEYLIEEILGITKLLTQEPRIEDSYIAKLVFLLNAGILNPKVKSLLPKFVLLHSEFIPVKYLQQIHFEKSQFPSEEIKREFEFVRDMYLKKKTLIAQQSLHLLISTMSKDSFGFKYLTLVGGWIKNEVDPKLMNELEILYPWIKEETRQDLVKMKSNVREEWFPRLLEMESCRVECEILSNTSQTSVFHSWVPWRFKFDAIIKYYDQNVYIKVKFPDQMMTLIPAIIQDGQIHQKLEMTFEKWNVETFIEMNLIYKLMDLEVDLCQHVQIVLQPK